METIRMYSEPQISDEQCRVISSNLGIDLTNNRAHDGDKLIIKEGRTIVDTIFSFTDKRYANIEKRLSDNVLILGLGFGSTILRACANDNVKSVTVIEIRKEVVELFYLIHGYKFKGFEKLTIIIADAFEYMKTDYNHVFIDIYHNPFDYTIYNQNMKMLINRFKDSIVHYIDLNQ